MKDLIFILVMAYVIKLLKFVFIQDCDAALYKLLIKVQKELHKSTSTTTKKKNNLLMLCIQQELAMFVTTVIFWTRYMT